MIINDEILTEKEKKIVKNSFWQDKLFVVILSKSKKNGFIFLKKKRGNGPYYYYLIDPATAYTICGGTSQYNFEEIHKKMIQHILS